MSDYMFMLENHLSAEQNRVVTEVQAAATLANVGVFLAGGAMRDMLGGFQVRDLDFSVEGNALKLAKAVAEKTGARTVATDEVRKSAELVFPGGVTAQIAMARAERYGKTGGKPQIAPATIQEDLRGRDFTVNAIALSLNRASRGLLLDPTNGLADLEHRELRAVGIYTLYDEPVRLLRLIRFAVRLNFAIDPRTRQQYENARAAEVEKLIPPRSLFEELRQIAQEPSPSEVLKALEQEGLLTLFSPILAGPKFNLAGLAKLDKAMRLLPDQAASRAGRPAPFLYALTEKFAPREKSELAKRLEMRKPEIDAWQKLEARARKLEHALKSARVKKPSQVYGILSKAPADEVCFVLYRSALKPVQERVKNYFQKYLPLAMEIGPEELAAITARPGTPQYEKARTELVAAHLDRRPRRAAAPAPEPPPEPAPRGRPRVNA
ncbi:MAG: hypothetical protein ACE15B_17370 [Bryobacteraceae bacterium]